MDPRSIWAVSAEDIRRLQGDEGRFTALVNDLIVASARKAGVHLSEVRTNLKTKFADGGVDTQVLKPIPDANGWMERRTLWQLKATTHDAINAKVLTEEIEGKKSRKKSQPKPRFVVERLEKNYAYRFCIADSIPPSKKQEWEKHLAAVVNQIKPNRYAPRVVSAEDLAAWVSRFPALVIEYFRPGLDRFQSYSQWSREATSLTESYVPLQQWQAASARIADHIDLKRRAYEPVLMVRGLSGVGKTRLVHEIVRASAELIVFTDREQGAEDLAVGLASREDRAAILIADECSIGVSDRLNQRLQAHTDRLRVIAIDNSGKKAFSPNEIWLEKMPAQALEAILAENFATVPADTRARFAELSRGYPRFAADLCKNAPRVEAEGRVSRLDSVEVYLRPRLERLTGDNRLRVSCLDALEVCSLIHRVGWKRGTLAGRELEDLCRLLDIEDVDGIREAIRVINQSTGFIALAGDSCYVTPEIVSETALYMAFRERIGLERDAIEQFFEHLPEPYWAPFMERLERLEPGGKGEEVRRLAGEYFRAWVARLTISDLERRSNAERLMRVVEAEPGLLTTLRELVERSSLDDLRRITGAYQDGGVGPRTTLVWHLSLLAAFPEHFDDAELILRRLALAESEPGLGNNATAVWSQLFSIAFSGTSIDFEARLRRLGEVLLGASEGEIELGRRALDAIWSPSGGRFVGPERIGGRYRPPEWQPRDRADLERSQRAAVDLLVRMARSRRRSLVDVARAVTAQSVRELLRGGFLDEIRSIFGKDELPPDLINTLLRGLTAFLRLDAPRRSALERESDRVAYVARVRRLFAELVPDTLHNRLLRELSLPLQEDESEPGALAALAQEMVTRPGALAAELPYISSVGALSAFRLGEALGHVDLEASCLELILRAAAGAKMMTFHRGYVAGLLDRHPTHAPTVNSALDAMQASSAAAVVELAAVHPRLLGAGTRALALLEQGSLVPEQLFRLEGVAYQRALGNKELAGLLRALHERGAAGDALAYELGIRVIHGWLSAPRRERRARLPKGAEPWAFRILEAATGAATSGAVRIQRHAWKQCMKELGRLRPLRAIRVAAGALATDSHALAPFQGAAEEVLLELAAEHPERVMQAVGSVILDPRRGFSFYLGRYRDLVQGLPPDVVIRWLRRSGVEGARRIARHLPPPRLDAEGRPVVPELTHFVLSELADDERVFAEFCAGVHSLQLYGGDMAAQHEHEAEVARRFLDHSLRRIRQWARLEVRDSLASARRERALLKAG